MQQKGLNQIIKVRGNCGGIMYNGVYPAYIRPYTGLKPNIVKRKGDEEQSSNASGQESSGEQKTQKPVYTNANNFQLSGYRNIQASKKVDESKQTINVSQILTDFKSTTNAVGAPKDIADEVNTYLGLVETQIKKDVPNKKIVQTNLKTASQVLDDYISTALKTKSNVVENWIDALFLQKIDYKADPNAINPDFKIDFGKSETAKKAENTIPQADNSLIENNKVHSDDKMKMLFGNAKKLVSESKNTKGTLIALKKALNYAEELDDKKMQSMIYYETADFYNKKGLYPQALKGYKMAADIAEDENIVAKAYMKTGKIYDEAGLIEHASKHWFSAISYAGESDNVPLQIKALTNLANVAGETYNKPTAYQYAQVATDLADQTQNDKIKGYTYKKVSQISEYFNDNSKALQSLKISTKSYSNIQDNKNVIENYISAADIMGDLGNKSKARNLLNKAYLRAVETDNVSVLGEISQRIAKIAS